MASITYDKTTGWWSIRYKAAPNDKKQSKKTLGKHPGTPSKSRPPKTPPDEIRRLAAPFLEIERLARLGYESVRTQRTPLAPYVQAYRDRAALTQAKNTTIAVRVACTKFVAYCEARGCKNVEDVTYAVCREWVASRLKAGAARSSVTTERNNLRPIWTQAAAERIVRENPWDAAKVPGKSRREVPTAWTRDEAAELVNCLDGWLRDLVQLGLNTGIRISALLSLRWSQVDWAAGLIRVRAGDSKSGRPYEVPITPTAHDVLARRLASSASGSRVFENPATGRPYTPCTTFQRIERAVKRAGISDYGDYNHCMRRTFGTLALNSGVPLEVVSRCLDHATLAQTQKAYATILSHRLIGGMAGFDVGGGSSADPVE